ncbi:16S rRNA (cytosine(1402)-N(4))-methyltransferase RsmH [Streptomyces sp. SID11385]|uniref:16S rRNA (cytosine(1402)-N(4))-methyltransferase RsmH n=1 Tax=Streptomyces sp. SID11385 TaxID=2706031 RepID=UPI0023B2FFCB|nr:16S rRNA (cytosine(1402)-N(4))-methyltransferase RsmH [Streptomyces sp. SID11385]
MHTDQTPEGTAPGGTAQDRPAPAAGTAEGRHVPVMLRRCLDLLGPALAEPGAVVVDCTLGLGGHSEALLRTFPAARLVALDRDKEALRLAGERLAPFGERATLAHAVYDELPDVLDRLGVPRVQGVLFDLGVSSMQLDEADRGFAYAQDAPLDMRMDQTAGMSAAEVLNTYPPGELVRILRTYGEEKQARRIVSAVVREREKEPFDRSARLVELIREALPQAAKRTGGNPAKRTFQALRIEVNGELSVLERAIPAAVNTLAVGGRIAVLSYHSLEDRLVKQVLSAGATSTAPPGLPVVPERYQPRLKLLTRGAELPAEEEVAANRRAAPARLRGAERLREGAV